MAFDYSKLKGRIIEKYGTQAAFAKAMGTSQKNTFLENGEQNLLSTGRN